MLAPNTASKWGRAEVNELTNWLWTAPELIRQAIDYHKHGAFNRSKKYLGQPLSNNATNEFVGLSKG